MILNTVPEFPGPIAIALEGGPRDAAFPRIGRESNSLCFEESDSDDGLSVSDPLGNKRERRIQNIVADAIEHVVTTLSRGTSFEVNQALLEAFQRSPACRSQILTGVIEHLKSAAEAEDSEDETYIIAERHRPAESPSSDSSVAEDSCKYLKLSYKRRIRLLKAALKPLLEEVHGRMRSFDDRLNGVTGDSQAIAEDLKSLQGTPKALRLLLDLKELESKVNQIRMIQEEIYRIRHGGKQAKIAMIEDFVAPEARPIAYEITFKNLRETFASLKDRFTSYYSEGSSRHFM